MIVFHGPHVQQTIVRGTVRNVSFGGVGVVFDVATEVEIGTAVEVRIDVSGSARRFVAGTVAYCRLGEGGAYEVGIKVRASGLGPILTPDTEQAKQLYSWFAEGLRRGGAIP